ncbi:Histone-lysine N-methyltransferase EZH1 [Galdieria sulphuraria]|nr:Histone-lysine N-methyltransferase EZH1 [Galdieria sulphuraria]
MSDGSLEKLLQGDSHHKFRRTPLQVLKELLEENLSARLLSAEKRKQFEKCSFLCDFVITVWDEIHKRCKNDPELEEANVLRILDQSAFLIASFLKYKNFEVFEKAGPSLSMSLRGLEGDFLHQTVNNIICFLRAVGVKLQETPEHDISAEAIWEFLSSASMALLKEYGQKVRLEYLFETFSVRQSDSVSEANVLFYGILERRISLLKKVIEENRRKFMSRFADLTANRQYVSPFRVAPEGRTISVAFSEKFSKNTSSKVVAKTAVTVMSKIERLPYEYFTWVPLKTNYKDNIQSEIYTKLLKQNSPLVESDLFPQNANRMNTERFSLADKLFNICYKLTLLILEKNHSVSADHMCTYSSVCPETYLPLIGTVPKNLLPINGDTTAEFLFSRLFEGRNYERPTVQKLDSCLNNSEQAQDLGTVLRKWFCRKCYTYACGEHLPTEVSLPQKFFNLAYEANATPVLSPPCLNGCVFNVEAPSWYGVRCHVWTNEDVVAFKSFLRVFGNNWCDIATVFFQKHSCYECAFFAESNSSFRKKATKKNGQRKKNQSNRNSTVIIMDHIHCSHDDDCNSENCSCKKQELKCEKYCPCYLLSQGNCRNSSTCCFCENGKCLNGQCPCFIENRTWDESIYTCKNIGIRTKAHKRLFIARSDYHEGGWGLFITEPVEKHEFICEYKGELVSLDECERREKSYQAMTDMTFVFKRGEVYIDATRKGGKARFANEPGTKALPNCYSRYKRTMGDIRVGIYADRNIQAELIDQIFASCKAISTWSHTALGSSAAKFAVVNAQDNNLPGPRGNRLS